MNLRDYIDGAIGHVDIGHCVGTCGGRPYGVCKEDGHTRFKRMIKYAYAKDKIGSEEVKIDCVPVEFESIRIPLRNEHGVFVLEEFTTLRAKACGCR